MIHNNINDYWESFVVKDIEHKTWRVYFKIDLYTIKSLKRELSLKVYQRKVMDADVSPLVEKDYVTKDELKRHLEGTHEFTFSLNKVCKKKGNVLSDVTKKVLLQFS